MMILHEILREALKNESQDVEIIQTSIGDVNLHCTPVNLKSVLACLKQTTSCAFDQLIDICAVDYLHYGRSDWDTDAATEQGFSRAVMSDIQGTWHGPRFAVVYHLLSTVYAHRVRVKVFLEETALVVPSVCDLWKSANWYEREAYDLFGVLFEGHPDLRRILTDYGFVGHPFRKDFPVSGYVEMRYDATAQKVIYEAVDIEPRVTVPRVIRSHHASTQVNKGADE